MTNGYHDALVFKHFFKRESQKFGRSFRSKMPFRIVPNAIRIVREQLLRTVNGYFNFSSQVIENLNQCRSLEHLDLSDNDVTSMGDLTPLVHLKVRRQGLVKYSRLPVRN